MILKTTGQYPTFHLFKRILEKVILTQVLTQLTNNGLFDTNKSALKNYNNNTETVLLKI